MAADLTDFYSGVAKQAEPIPVGFELSVTHYTMPMPEHDGVGHLPLSMGSGSILALSVQTGGFAIHGSAVMVAPGIALTAKHVIDQLRAVDDLAPIVALSCDVGGKLIFWNAVAFTPIYNFDLAFLALQPMSPLDHINTLVLPTLAAKAPVPGERLNVLGFRESSPVQGTSEILLSLFQSVGVASEVFGTGRDCVLLPNPCVEANLVVVGGMSGGPVFDSSGHLIGVVSTSVSAEDPRPAYLSLVWPAIVAEFTTVWPPGLHPEKTTLKELTAVGTTKVVGAELVTKALENEATTFSLGS